MDSVARALQDALADRYRIEGVAGAGGMATVFLAEDLKHHRRVAIKILSPELAAALGPDRFLREIEIAARLAHPHILPLHDSGVAAGLLYYVMPYVKGESLRERLRRETQLPLGEALRIAHEVADALSYAHAQGVMHRDIKPENILLQSGYAVVADFGIARAIEAAGTEQLTRTGIVLGTPVYMSPEQASGGRTDARSDVYALGCVLYEMLAGQPPFVGPSAEAVIYQHLSVEAPPVTNLRAGVPARIVKLLHRALAKSPADRFPDAGRMAEELARAESAPEDDHRSPAGPTRWIPLAAVVLLAAIVVVLGLRMGLVASFPAGVHGAIRSLAVLPLENVSSGGSQDYFVEGLTEELINRLSRIPSLRVISRTSVMSLTGLKLSVPEVAQRLHVDGVVEGSVARVGETVRVSEPRRPDPGRPRAPGSAGRRNREYVALASDAGGARACLGEPSHGSAGARRIPQRALPLESTE